MVALLGSTKRAEARGDEVVVAKSRSGEREREKVLVQVSGGMVNRMKAG